MTIPLFQVDRRPSLGPAPAPFAVGLSLLVCLTSTVWDRLGHPTLFWTALIGSLAVGSVAATVTLVDLVRGGTRCEGHR